MAVSELRQLCEVSHRETHQLFLLVEFGAQFLHLALEGAVQTALLLQTFILLAQLSGQTMHGRVLELGLQTENMILLHGDFGTQCHQIVHQTLHRSLYCTQLRSELIQRNSAFGQRSSQPLVLDLESVDQIELFHVALASTLLAEMF